MHKARVVGIQKHATVSYLHRVKTTSMENDNTKY